MELATLAKYLPKRKHPLSLIGFTLLVVYGFFPLFLQDFSLN